MELLSGADIIIRFLKDEGIKYVYGYPGGAALHIYDALFRQNFIKHILVRHEQAATHMADGYARATGNPGVVLVTSGPGATNAVTGIATAYMDSIPMIVICGQVASNMIGEDAFQEIDIIGITRTIVKHSFTINHPLDIPIILKKAFYISKTGRPGPVLIDIPKDMTLPTELYEYIYPQKIEISYYNNNNLNFYNDTQIKKAIKIILNSKKPVLFAGGGVIIDNASKELFTLVQYLNLPVITSLMGIGSYPQDNSQYIGWVGMHGSFEANNAMHYADLIICIGARFDDRVTNNVIKFCPLAKIIHIDIDPSSISKTVYADIKIIGYAKDVLNDIIIILNNYKYIKNRKIFLEYWWKCIQEWRKKIKVYELYDKNDLLNPKKVIESVHKITNGDAFVVTDVGQHQMFVAQYYKFNKPRFFITSGGLGTMGFGLPAAMGIKLCFPKKHVILFTGEGSFQMMMQELSTCKQFNIPIKIINLNNGTLGMVRQLQNLNYDSRYSNSNIESLPNFKHLFNAYGFKTMSIKTLSELDYTLKKAFFKNELIFIDIYIDHNKHVYPMQIPLGSINDLIINIEKTI
ncbi:Acetolactate synthase large subunit [Candidatus Johnevansia muelleri]|uniref:Acetolactate synthase n=1 Tax=Candidatus Johnevansia muelleri TaxID=1495769 RepID=A0A078KE95_9GAMM|nr:Acetolactate synthase large subunit [Candidatus Evansia muelleri]